MKKFVWFLACFLVFFLTACSGSDELIDESVNIPEEIIVVEPTELEIVDEPVVDAIPEATDEPSAPQVFTETVEGSAEYQGYGLTYAIETPVFEDFPEESVEILSAYYDNLTEKYVSYAENEAVYQLESLAWDGDFVYAWDCNVVYLSDTMVSFLRTAEAPTQETYYYSETFSLENGGLVTLDYLFGQEESAYRQGILDYILDFIANDDELSSQLSLRDDNWRDAVTSQLDLDQFFITEDGLSVYFQHNQLGLGVGFSIIIPWENLPEALK
ncbi:MAG: hypothetical protein R3Y62_00735 [Eubacteriales bacterium]